jgi:hypothetical protein
MLLSVLVVGTERHEDGVALPAAAQVPAQVAIPAITERLRPLQRVVNQDGARGFAGAVREIFVREILRAAARVIVRWNEAWVGLPVLDAERLAETALGPTALRDDVDHARVRIGAVERRRRRSFHDIYAFDVFDLDVVQPAALTVPDTVDLAVLRRHAHAIDEYQRIVRQLQRRQAADVDLRRDAARAARVPQHYPRRARLQQVRHRLNRRIPLDV